MTTTVSTSSDLPDKDQIRVHVRRDGLIERQRFNARVCRQLCKYDGGEQCQAFVVYRRLCVGHYHQTSGITINESKRRQLIQQSATAGASSKATTATMIPSKIQYSIATPLTLGLKNWRRKTAPPNSCSYASSIDSHADDYILAQKSISITASRLTDEQIDRLDQFLQRFNIHYSGKIDEKTTHLITDDTTIPFVCALSSKAVHALVRHLTVLSIRWIDECLHIVKYVVIQYVQQSQTKMIVVLCEQSYVQERQDKYWKCVELGIRFCSPEFINESIAQYQVQPQQNEDDNDEE
ncbi:unnamed protein product [Rotaria sp. Silwood2]|nr:unnamed protein product [Rotaria sp. Silwood2]